MQKQVLQCDVCNKEVKEFHSFGGNLSAFDVREVCDNCWEVLDGSVEDFRKELKNYTDKLINKYLEKARKV